MNESYSNDIGSSFELETKAVPHTPVFLRESWAQALADCVGHEQSARRVEEGCDPSVTFTSTTRAVSARTVLQYFVHFSFNLFSYSNFVQLIKI